MVLDASSASTGEYTVRLSSFQGPLDLLLYLIRRAEVDIHDIPVAAIADQYLAFVRQDLEHVDVEQAGEFLVMAATLIELKARTLAPRRPRGEGGEEDAAPAPILDPRTELVQALLAYQRYRIAGEQLEARRLEFSRRHPVRIGWRRQDRPEEAELEADEQGEAERAVELEDLHLLDLSEAYERIVGSIDFTRLGDHSVVDDDTPLALHQEDLIDRLARSAEGRLTFSAVIEGRTRMEMIGLFLATLELARQRRVLIEQADPMADVEVALVPDVGEPEEEGAVASE